MNCRCLADPTGDILDGCVIIHCHFVNLLSPCVIADFKLNLMSLDELAPVTEKRPRQQVGNDRETLKNLHNITITCTETFTALISYCTVVNPTSPTLAITISNSGFVSVLYLELKSTV